MAKTTSTTSWERTIRGDKGEFCVSAHVDSEGYPVVTVIPYPDDGFDTVVSDISHDGVEHALAAGENDNPVEGQLQTTFRPSPGENDNPVEGQLQTTFRPSPE